MHAVPRNEIVLPETKPETEWLRGRAVRKMSPLRDHARLLPRMFDELRLRRPR